MPNWTQFTPLIISNKFMGKLYFFIPIHHNPHTYTYTYTKACTDHLLECLRKGETVFITMFYLLSKTVSPVGHRSFLPSHTERVIGLDSETEKWQTKWGVCEEKTQQRLQSYPLLLSDLELMEWDRFFVNVRIYCMCVCMCMWRPEDLVYVAWDLAK